MASRRKRRLGQRHLSLERLEKRELLAALRSGTGDGHLEVFVNEFGAFGRSGNLAVANPLNPQGPREVNDAVYDPPGTTLGAAGTVFESGIAVKVGGDPVTFLTAGTIANTGNFTNGLFTQVSTTRLVSTFFYPATAQANGQGATLRFDLVQELIPRIVSGSTPVGVTLRQAYTITNLTSSDTPLSVWRYVDGDMLFDGTFTNDGAGMRQIVQNEPERVWMTNLANNTNRNELTYMEVRTNVPPALPNDGISPNLPRQDRWEVGLATGSVTVVPNPPCSAANPCKNEPHQIFNGPLVDKILDELPLAGDIFPPTADIDNNNMVDNGILGDWAVALKNIYTLRGSQQLIYATETQWGDPEIGDPDPPIIIPPPTGAVVGMKFSDRNANGARDPGEQGVQGFRIYADSNNNGIFDPGEPSTLTDRNGNYSLSLPVGTHTIREVNRTGWTQTFPGTGSYLVTIANAGDVFVDVNFGNFAQPGQVSGTVFEDFNRNARFDTGEFGIPGVVVFADVNNDGVLNVGEPSTISGPTGAYTLLNVEPGLVVIRQIVPAGFDQSFPANGQGHVVTVQPAGSVSNLNFGNVLRSGSINGSVFVDLNGDGIRNPGEPGVANAIVWVDANDDCSIGLGENAIVTGPSGTFGLFGVRPGTYTVRVSLPPGFEQTEPPGGGTCPPGVVVTVLPGGSTDVDFGTGQISSIGPDFGDAPAPYPTTLAQNGARHTVVRDFGLGLLVDGEPNGQPSFLANGDDTNSLDDEDGIIPISPAPLSDGTGILRPGQLAVMQVTVRTGGRFPGLLQGFIDFNRDGDWNDPGERIVLDRRLGEGVHFISFVVPSNASIGRTYARFRYGYEPGLGPTGPSIAGEVEDYTFFIVGATPDARDDVFNLTTVAPNIPLDVLANDIPSQSGDITIVAVGPTSGSGTVTIAADGRSLLYTPSGVDTQEVFTYTIQDPAGNQDTATVTVNLRLPPIANDDTRINVSTTVPTLFNILNPADPLFNERGSVLVNDLPGTGGFANLRIISTAPVGASVGTLLIQPDGVTLQYIPQAGSSGVQQFTYTVVNTATGDTSTATLTLLLAADPTGAELVRFDIELLELDGSPLTRELARGEQFLVRVLTDDLRGPLTPPTPDRRGVFAGFMDMLYDAGRIIPVPSGGPLGFEITFGSFYGFQNSGDASVPGLINEVGSVQQGADPPSPGPDPVELFTITFQVRGDAASGTSVFILDPADVFPDHNTLLRDPGPPPVPRIVAPSEIIFTNTSVVIDATLPPAGGAPEPGGEPQVGNTPSVVGTFANAIPHRNWSNPFDVNGDGFITPLDALSIINELNAAGSRSLVGAQQPSPAAGRYFIDVNGDNALTPFDALLVINYLNSGGASGEAAPVRPPLILLGAAAASAPAAETLTLAPGESVTLPMVEIPAPLTSDSTVEISDDLATDVLAGSESSVHPCDDAPVLAAEYDFGPTGSAGSRSDDDFDSLLGELAQDTCLRHPE